MATTNFVDLADGKTKKELVKLVQSVGISADNLTSRTLAEEFVVNNGDFHAAYESAISSIPVETKAPADDVMTEDEASMYEDMLSYAGAPSEGENAEGVITAGNKRAKIFANLVAKVAENLQPAVFYTKPSEDTPVINPRSNGVVFHINSLQTGSFCLIDNIIELVDSALYKAYHVLAGNRARLGDDWEKYKLAKKESTQVDRRKQEIRGIMGRRSVRTIFNDLEVGGVRPFKNLGGQVEGFQIDLAKALAYAGENPAPLMDWQIVFFQDYLAAAAVTDKDGYSIWNIPEDQTLINIFGSSVKSALSQVAALLAAPAEEAPSTN